MAQSLRSLRDRWRDPLLTALTVLLALLLFVLAPLRADNMEVDRSQTREREMFERVPNW